ncbi:MAG: terpene cyclase/mutase family protein [Aeromicrobium erythreum]
MTLRPGRLAALATSGILAVGALVATPTTAQAAPNSYAYSAARWLEDQLTDGVFVNPAYDFADYGLTIDVYFTLKDLDTRAATQSRIISALSQKVDDYTTSGEYGPDDRYAGATGKLAAAVQASGGDATSFGGVDLVQRAEERVVDSGAAAGRAKDLTSTGDDYSNTIGQSWVVRALDTAGSADAASTLAYLLRQQCANGAFRINLEDSQCATPGDDDVLSLDATALAVQTLEGIDDPALSDEITRSVDYLVSQQAADGSFSDQGTPNTNTTGLAAATLRSAGRTAEAGAAASWIVGKQVTDANAEDSKLANELGAIAYDPTAFAQGRTDGITDATRDQWVRATAQAAAGVNAQLPATTFTVTGPTGFVQGGKAATITVDGLVARERYTVSGAAATPGKAAVTGATTIAVTPSDTTANRVVTVTGGRSVRTGNVTIKVLGTKKIGISLNTAKVAAGKRVNVYLSGLVPGEKAQVSWRGKRLAAGVADRSGKVTYKLSVGSTKGSASVVGFGQFTTRTNKTTLRVS